MGTSKAKTLHPGRRLLQLWPLAILCLAFLSACSPAVADQGPLKKSYQVEKAAYEACVEAGKLMEARSYDRARDVLLAAAASDPTSYSGNIHNQLASCYFDLDDFRNAIAQAEVCLKSDPRDRGALYTEAIAYNKLAQYDKAVHVFNDLLKVTTDPASASQIKRTIKEIQIFKNVDQANKLMKAGKDTEARPFLEAAATFDPSDDSWSIHGNLAYVLERTGHPQEAIAEGKKALTFPNASCSTMYTLGIAYQDLGKFDDAISWLKRYISAETDADSRNKASVFMQELSDDRAKLDPKDNEKPDYLDQLEEKDAAYVWPQKRLPIKVYIPSGKGVSGYRPIFRPFIVRSLNTWCDTCGKKLSYKIVDDKKDADMVIEWTRDPLTLDENGRVRQKAGLTSVDRETKKSIKHALVQIRTVNGFDPNRLVTDGEAASVSMHEIGHAMGLGHSTLCSDIMYFGASSMQNGFPTKRDRATIVRLYKDYPVIAFTPQSAPIPKDKQIEYLPPPAFLPPVPSNTDKLPPPMFMPPPVKSESEKLQPPMFVPPPIEKPAASKGTPKVNQKESTKIPPPFFVPVPK